MTAGYTKLFGSIVHSTVWREPNHVRIVWVTMLALADADGYVGASLPGLADVARVTMEQCEDALARLASPDPYSRTPDNEGRRLVATDRGWRLLNYEKFRNRAGRWDGTGGNPTTQNKQGKVYFIRLGEFIKIGFSQNPWARLNALKTGQPEQPELLGYMTGTPTEERELHDRFNYLRHNREWFRHDAELITFIKENTTVATGSRVASATDNYENYNKVEAEAEADLNTPPITPQKGSATKRTSPRRKPKRPIPDDWSPNAAHTQKAATLGINLSVESEKFRNNATGKDVRWVDWDKAFHNWLLQAAAFAASSSKAPGLAQHDAHLEELDQHLLKRAKDGEFGEKAKARARAGQLDLVKLKTWLREKNQQALNQGHQP